jgi:hypothetical protein
MVGNRSGKHNLWLQGGKVELVAKPEPRPPARCSHFVPSSLPGVTNDSQHLHPPEALTLRSSTTTPDACTPSPKHVALGLKRVDETENFDSECRMAIGRLVVRKCRRSRLRGLASCEIGETKPEA